MKLVLKIGGAALENPATLQSCVRAIKSLVQISLRIGTRAPLLMIGSLVLMVTTSRELALTMLPLLVVTSALIVFFIVKMEPLFRTVQAKLDALLPPIWSASNPVGSV